MTKLLYWLILLTSSPNASAECEDESACILGGKVCTGREGECCEGLACFGFNFFKTCQAVPTCLSEWFDCKNSIPCCDGYHCTETPSGLFECQTPKIGTRSVDFSTGFIIAEPPSPPQIPPKNLKTTKRTGNWVRRACLTGDPHISSFDGFSWECQGHGEFVLLKSLVTQREIQGRFKQFGKSGQVSIATGFVVQDEGDSPRIQITAPETKTGFAQIFGPAKCQLQLFVDGVQQDLLSFENDKVKVGLVRNGSTLEVSYKLSGLRVDLRVGGGMFCMMNICVYVPDSDDNLVGLLGSPDGKSNNDWMDKTGKVLARGSSRGKDAYDYCLKNWCINNEHESLFFYNQLGANFKHFSRCEIPHGGDGYRGCA